MTPPTALFVYGSLRHLPLLHLVLGRAPDTRPAHLPGHAVYWAAGESFPMIVAEAGGRAEGLLVEGLTQADIARLDFYEGAFAYDLVAASVDTEAGPAPAQVYFPEPGKWPLGARWSLDDWVRDWGALTLEAAGEVMRQFGQVSPTEIAGRFGMIRSRAQSRLRAQAAARPATTGGELRAGDVQIETLAHPYDGFFTLEEYTLRHRRFAGGMSDPHKRVIFRASDAVTVLPYDPVRDRVLLVEQMRIGALAHGDAQPWLLEPVAGIVDAGETYEQTAHRETQEEAGVRLDALHLAGRYYPSPGGVAQILVSYLGIADLPDDMPGLGGLDSEDEDIRSHLVGFEALMAMLESGELANAPLLITAQWLAANRTRLREAAL